MQTRTRDNGVSKVFPATHTRIAVGSARLPKSVCGEQLSTLIVEFVLDSQNDCVVDVATTIPLPGYAEMLRSLIIGRRLDEVEGMARVFSAHLRGPFLKPTLAAVADCVRNATKPCEAIDEG